ncbi:hypothetical protein [Brevundimonas lenta]|uniref:Uncharacterized protein n=1 Tax=Brevundimonas lenta TaxID=424796 RepID=A0A7W6JEK6_9CAUL|nr:hypothetical protein [Brevundimonas lenta]MBB4083679.1 hypothetical protein [Brevundimonas lenta]
MEYLSSTPGQRLEGYRAYARAADSFSGVAWKAPSAHRFENTVANDAPSREPTVGEVMKAVPAWLVVAGGAVAAALMGAMLGGALHI